MGVSSPAAEKLLFLALKFGDAVADVGDGFDSWFEFATQFGEAVFDRGWRGGHDFAVHDFIGC